VSATGSIGFFKIISETSIAAGIRRIEAYTARKAEDYIDNQLGMLNDIKALLDTPNDLMRSVASLADQNAALQKKVEEFNRQEVKRMKNDLKANIVEKSGVNFIAEKVTADSTAVIKDLAFQLKNEIENLFLALGAEIHGKAHIAIMISENLVKEKNLHAGKIVKELAKEIGGGGGGQPFFATAGGTNTAGILKVLEKAEEFIG
jgi:alanyl-tRNA synthetase